MASTRPSVYISNYSETNNGVMVTPELAAYAEQYFNLITNEELRKHNSTGQKVTGAIIYIKTSSQFYEHLPSFTNCRAVASFGAGINHIDFPRMANLGIKVSTTPRAICNAVAEMTVALILASARKIVAGDAFVKGTVSSAHLQLCNQDGLEVRGSTVGIVGMGNIGLITARLLRAIGATILYHNRNRRCTQDEESVGAAYHPDLLEMLGVSDFVVVLCPLTPHTHHLISKPQLAAMKPTATLVNVGRGAVVDTDALVEALRTNQIRGAALDVTDPELLPAGHPLRSEPRVILTPHWGSNTRTAKVDGFKMAVDNLKAVLIDNVAMPNEVKEEKA